MLPSAIKYCAAIYVNMIHSEAYGKGVRNLFIANKESDVINNKAPVKIKIKLFWFVKPNLNKACSDITVMTRA